MIRSCLTFFQVCGFFPVEVQDSLTSISNGSLIKLPTNWKLVFLSFLHAVVVVCLILYVGIDYENVLYAKTPIGEINDILVYFSLLLTHLVILIESFVKRKYFVIYWWNYEKLLTIGRKHQNVRKWQKWLSIKIVVVASLSFMSEIIVISNIQTDHQWCKFWYLEVYSLLMTKNRHLQHIFFIDVVFFSLQDINSRMKSASAWTKSVGEQNCSHRFIYRNLSHSKEQLKHLMEMLVCINKLFCWSQALNFGQHFIEITAELYWVYVYATGPDFLFATIITMIPAIVVIAMLLLSATRCIKEVRLMTLIES